MKSAGAAVHWIEGSFDYKLPYLYQNVRAQMCQTSHPQPVVFLGKKLSYKLPLVSALESAVCGRSSLVVGDNISRLSAEFSALIADCPPWFNRRASINRWEFGQGGKGGTLTLSGTSRTDSQTERFDSAHVAGFDDPETFTRLATNLQSVTKKITWYPFHMFPRDHPFVKDIVIPAIHNKALFLAR